MTTVETTRSEEIVAMFYAAAKTADLGLPALQALEVVKERFLDLIKSFADDEERTFACGCAAMASYALVQGLKQLSAFRN